MSLLWGEKRQSYLDDLQDLVGCGGGSRVALTTQPLNGEDFFFLKNKPLNKKQRLIEKFGFSFVM